MASSPSRVTSAQRVLEVSELSRMICHLLPKEELVKLLYLSRRTYASTLPIVWEDADLGLALRLIPGMRIKGPSEDNPNSYVFNFPNNADMTQFNNHAPFVKTLRASRPYSIDFPENWLGNDANRNPFPNLRYIIVHAIQGRLIGWISRFLYPGLLGVDFMQAGAGHCFDNSQSEHIWVDQDVSFNLIDRIVHTCPKIQTLSLFPFKIGGSSIEKCAPVYNNLASLHELQSLAISGAHVHQELLEAIGQLAHLKTLSLCNDWAEEWAFDDIPLNLSDSLFPSLRHLCLHGLYEFTMSHLCKAPVLFRNLISATIVFEDTSFDENLSDQTRSEAAIASLGQNTPHLKDLMILPRGNYGYFVASWPAIEVFKQMPLQSLDLGEVRLYSKANSESEEESESDEDDEDDEDGEEKPKVRNIPPPPVEWPDLLASVPHLEELRMELQEIRPQDLRLFASSLPRLRVLVIGTVPLGDAHAEAHEPAAGHNVVLSSWSYFRSAKERADDEVPDPESVLNAARYIYGVWPNVRCETHSLKWSYGEAESHKMAVAKLNEALESLKSKDK